MTPKSDVNHSFEIAGFTSIEPGSRVALKKLIADLIAGNEEDSAGIVEAIVQMVGSACDYSTQHPLHCEYSGLIIDYLLNYFLVVRNSHESEFYHFLNLMNHVPITVDSPFYHPMLKTLRPIIDKDPGLLELFNRLQMLYIFTENRDYENANLLMEELEPLVNKDHLQYWVLFQICKARMLRYQNNFAELMRMHLWMILEAYNVDGSDCALNLILRWILATNWQKLGVIKKALLMRIHDRIGEQKSLNGAIVLYELFSMEDRLVPSSEKTSYQKRLIKFPATILNVQQLHSLYFFAGYYYCGVLSKFKDSIQNYQYSNYFLHKSWERLLTLSRFMREQLDTDTYYKAMPYLDARIREWSKQASLQNNAYVESLQANFDTIESLYEKVGELSLTDSLTGLRNRRFLDGNLLQMVILAARHKVPICFSMIDIDLFKLANDSFGHLAGDFVLKELSKLLINEFRKSDVIVRYGGEEFLVILFDSDNERSKEIMEGLRAKVESHSFDYRGNVIPITISIGIACDQNLDPQQHDLNKSISCADSALYTAKSNGRNSVAVYIPKE